MSTIPNELRPALRVAGCRPYKSPAPPFPIDLWLNGNEGRPPAAELLQSVASRFGEIAYRYPSVADLQAALCERYELPASRVLVTAGGDDALYRACMVMLERGREMILPTPSFEMLSRYARLAGGEVIETPWMADEFPTEDIIAAVTPRTTMIVVVSPNNPTGAVATSDDLRRLSAAVPRALLLVDLAYAEFADEDLTATALELPNTLAVRTLSKAWGLAGLRVGYALGPPQVIEWLRAAGNPYAVSGLSAALANAQWRTATPREYIATVRAERERLFEALTELGAAPLPSQANFVLAKFAAAAATWRSLAQRGIAVRAFQDHRELASYLRITCPGNADEFKRLLNALREAARETA